MHSPKEAKLKQIVLAVFMKNDARYGSPRIKESHKNAGMCVSKHRVERVLRKLLGQRSDGEFLPHSEGGTDIRQEIRNKRAGGTRSIQIY